VPAELITHPRRSLAAVASRPRLVPAALVVAVSGAVSLGFERLAAALAPAAFAPPPTLLYALLPLFLLGFWLLSGWLIDAGARTMARPRRLRAMLATVGLCFAPFAGYGVVPTLQALALRLGGGSPVAWAVGWLNAPLLVWFVALLGVAAVSVHRVEPPAAIALALLPLAALLGAVLLSALLAAALAGLHVG
jgi:hypothetical protein